MEKLKAYLLAFFIIEFLIIIPIFKTIKKNKIIKELQNKKKDWFNPSFFFTIYPKSSFCLEQHQ